MIGRKSGLRSSRILGDVACSSFPVPKAVAI